ncbi:HEAT repeat domain-containing protein [Streptomyces sp. NPDC059256]|uniref:HEAT repeat domain-containing protein n=1 Tax=Streptomyces sp. NPDC059256 TaxID=3346794 RepID=UPI0036770BC2
MDLERVFADLDGVPWADLDHAYGQADDLPDLLRALTGDQEQSTEALVELGASILHQGTVYGATVAAVPYLARLAAADVRTVEMLLLLGGIAESEDEFAAPLPGACRAAVVEQLPLILDLLASDDVDVRRTAAWAVGRTGCVSAASALRRLWADPHERHPGVRAETLAALAQLDPEGTPPELLSALDAAEPAVLRVTAVMAAVDAGMPFSTTHQSVLVSLLPAAPHIADRCDQERTEPLRQVVDVLLRRDTDEDRASAFALVEAALRLTEPAARDEALWAAEHACTISRSAPGRLAPALVPLLGDPSFHRVASLLPILDQLGSHAAPAAPALAELAATDGDLGDRALAVLARIAPEQAALLLARDLENRTITLASVTGTRGLRPGHRLPYAPELLNAIRISLSHLATADEAPSRGPVELLELLAGWGTRAAAALPELTRALDAFPTSVPAALVAICPPNRTAAVAELLRRAAVAGEVEARCAAAEALWRLTGETGPLVVALQAALREGSPAPHLVETAGRLGAAGRELVAELRSALTSAGVGRTNFELETDLQIALALWRLTGDGDQSVHVVGAVLAETAERMWSGRTRTSAARAAAEIGPAAKPLIPALEALLSDPVQVPGAVLALRSVGHPLQADRAADLLVTSAELDADPIGALEALRTLGPGALAPAVITRLTALAEGDLRVAISGRRTEIVAADERLRTSARALLPG